MMPLNIDSPQKARESPSFVSVAKITLADGADIAVRRWGTGEPLYLLHGGPGASGAYWPVAASYLGEFGQVVAPDLRGHGQSSRQGPYSIHQFANDVIEIATFLGHERYSLVGHSYGSLVALSVAAADNRVEKVVLIGGFSSTLRLIMAPFALLAKARMAVRLVGWNLGRRVSKRAHPRPFLRKLLRDGQGLFHGRRAKRYGESIDDLLFDSATDPLDPVVPLQWDLLRWNFTRKLQNITCPVLVLVGDEDRIGTFGSRAFAKRIIHVSVKKIEESGHSPFIEQPQRFREVVGAFLTDRN